MNAYPFSNTSRIELSACAFQNNVTFVKKQLRPHTLLSAVVKGNAYGHSFEAFIPLAEQSNIRHFSVFSLEEAWQVKQLLTTNSDIMIMGSVADDALDWVIEQGIQLYVFEIERLKAVLQKARNLGNKARLHLEFETGMNRTGFNPSELSTIRDLLNEYSGHFIMEGICTHYAGAESSANFLRVREQIKTFGRVVREVKAVGINAKRVHSACSAAALSYPNTQMDMVRIGIALYGYWPTRETFIQHVLSQESDSKSDPEFVNTIDPLKRVLSWKSHVMSTKTVPAGQFIGYGTSYLTGITTTIAAVPVGYAYGYSRNLSNLGRVIVGGKRTSVIGVVNMNMMLIDITETPWVKRGDEVVLIGRQNDQEISVASFSEMTQHINYESLVRLPSDIPRVVVD
jgi:alanine racemase